MAKQQNNGQEQDVNQLRKVRREKLADLQQNGKDPFQITKFNQTHHSLEVKSLYEAHEAELLKDHQTPDVEGMNEEQAKEVLKKDYEERRSIMDANPIHVSIAGRMMFKRVMGKASFCNIQDLQGSIQVYVARDAIGTDSYTDFKRSDIGDIFGLEGFAFRTRTGEISIHAEKMTLLSKSLQILPEKFHGLTDTDTRYRQRYVDLIMNPESKETFIKRSKIIKEIRNFLDGRGFMEVETPMLVSNAGGAAARPFETHYNALNEDVKLRISLELYLKRLIVGGLERVYEIGRVFRNEGVDTRHNPEFTLMELYQAYTDYEGMMELTESMFRYLAEKVCGSAVISYNGTVIDMAKPFERISMTDAVKKYAGVDFAEVKTDEEAKALADEHHVEYEERHKKGDILNLFFDEFCEEKMIQPTFVTDHPIEISPLTKKNPEDPNYVERFELYVYGREMCNAYSELNDPIDQRERFAAQEEAFAAGDEEANQTKTIEFASSHYDLSVEVAGVPAPGTRAGSLPVLEICGVSPCTDFENRACGEATDYLLETEYEAGKALLTARTNIMRHKNHENVNIRLSAAPNGEPLAEVNLARFLADNPIIDCSKHEVLIPIRIEFKSGEITVSVPEWYIEQVKPEF